MSSVVGGKISLIKYLGVWALLVWLVLVSAVKWIFTCWMPTKPKNVRGQLVLITGGSQGIGRGLAMCFAKAGCNVAIASRNHSTGMKTAEEIQEEFKKSQVKAFKCDVSKVEEVRSLQKEIKSTLGTVDILINNAGLLGIDHSLLEGDDDDVYQKMVDVNFTSYLWTARAFLPDMIRQRRGHVVGISSSQVLSSVPLAVTYCATKHANAGFIAALREDLCFYGYDDFIKTTSVHPSFVITNDELTEHLGKFMYKRFLNFSDVDAIAESIFEGIVRDKMIVCLPFFDSIVMRILEMLPRHIKTRMVNESMRKDTREKFREERREKIAL